MFVLLTDLNCEIHNNFYKVKPFKFYVQVFSVITLVFEDMNKMYLVRHVQWPLHGAYKNDI